MLEREMKVLESYYGELHAWNSDANWEDFDADMAWTRDRLRKVIYYLQIGDLEATGQYIPFLEELMAEVQDRAKVLDAVESVVEEIKEGLGVEIC